MRALFSSAILASLVAVAPVAAHHVSGVVYCDANGDNMIDNGDTKMNGISVRATSSGPLVIGSEFNATTPYHVSQNGRFYIDLATGTNDYTLAIVGGVPGGATFVSPAGGTTPISVVAGDPNLEAQVVDFLLTNCVGVPICMCDDGDYCTTDSCDANGNCTHAPVVCDDGNSCTDEFCDPDKGECVVSQNTKACNADDNDCTVGDTCFAGACVPGAPVVCNDGNLCTDEFCDPDKGECVVSENTKPCEGDNNECTKDACFAGACVIGAPLVCNDGNVCTDEFCDPEKGECVVSENTKPCEGDNNECTKDACFAGACAIGAPLVCNDGNVCTDEFCDPEKGECVVSENTKPCDADNDKCTTNDACFAGHCVAGTPLRCDDGNKCTTDLCDPDKGECNHNNNSGPCDDNNACTTNEQCLNGSCQGTAGSCDDNNPCTTDSCDANGGCMNTPNTDPCSDGNACTVNDQCKDGVCESGNAKSCDQGDQCNEPGACDPATGQCMGTPKPDGTNCSDGNACTTTDVCDKGICLGSGEKACTPLDACHTAGVCDRATGMCSNPVKPDGESCNDNNTCTSNDECKGGVCGGTSLECNDQNPCTDDSCGPNGCVYTNNTAACEDGDACTAGDICSAGACAGRPKACDDGNLCNGNESCNPDTGACESSSLAGPPFLFCSSARVNNRGTITGDIGVNDPQNGLLHLSRGVYMPDGTKATAHQVELAASASVCSVFADQIDQADTAEIRCGTGTPTLPIVTPCCEIPAVTCGGAAISLGNGETGAPLAPGSYAALSLAKNASIALLPGEFKFCSIDLSQGAHVTTSGATTIHSTGDLSVADLAYLGPDSGQPLPTINVAGTEIRLGEAGLIRGLVRAPNAEARFGRQATLEGTMCTNIIGTDKGITLSCQPQSNLDRIKKKQRRRIRRASRANS